MIFMARHGETDHNRPPVRVMGHLDAPLNETGREQAAELAERAAREGIVALYASPLQRAWDTAQVVGEKLGIEPVRDERLMESYRGEWEGLLWDDIERDHPDGFAAWKAAEGFSFPGGESLREQADRVAAALDDIRARGAFPALAVTHGGCIRVTLSMRDGGGVERFHEFDVPNGTLIPL